MGGYVASQLVKAMTKRGIAVQGSRVLVMGLTFKENTPDLRNSRVIDIIEELRDYDVSVDVYDPWADPTEAKLEYGVALRSEPEPVAYRGIVLAVAHEEFCTLTEAELDSWSHPDGAVIYDLKYVLPKPLSDLRL